MACTRTRKFSTASPEQNPRRFVAFVGGLDITDGRWDTPKHELFSTLNNEHTDDFYQKFAPGVEKRHGPREPWHDIHSKVEGKIAFDVFENFWERWQQQGLNEGEMIHVRDTSVDIDAPLDMDPQKSWNVQFFRSITSDSAVFDEERLEHVSIFFAFFLMMIHQFYFK